MNNISYHKALELLHKVSTDNGFLASAENTSNYKRVWARDGVICGLAALASADEKLITTFRNTLVTLAENQHEIGTIPSNVLLSTDNKEVSYGGLAGRVDAVTWFIIGICQYAHHQNEPEFVQKYQSHIEKALQLLNAWEFNNKHLLYVPLSGNWADEYITDGYVLYDQLLRIWALKSYNHFVSKHEIAEKIDKIIEQIEINFTPHSKTLMVEMGLDLYHERAYDAVNFQEYLPCSFSPSGYKTQFDAFANALVVLLDIGNEATKSKILNHASKVAEETKLGLVPAFWPPVFQDEEHWNLLKNNCKYEFRNFPYEFHNGGSWPMVNGFVGLAFLSKNQTEQATTLLEKINTANAIADYSFYENFNTHTQEPNGVAYCAWSAAAGVLLEHSLHHNFKLLF
jgi:GH15 family glucan-1,4-alpha-glucosidase